MSKRTHCPICASHAPFLPHPGFERVGLVTCPLCLGKFSNAVPSHPELKRHYSTYSRQRTVSRLTERRYDELLDDLDAYRVTGKILDYGCGKGAFARSARRRGWNVSGIEMDSRAVRDLRAMDIDAHPPDVSAEVLGLRSFDVVTMMEVVEHLQQPLDAVEQAAALLRKGGISYVTTPNFDSLSRRLVGNRWTAIEYPAHLTYFTSSTLERLWTEAGFATEMLVTENVSPNELLRAIRGGSSSRPRGSTEDNLRRQLSRSQHVRKAVKVVNRYVLSPGHLGDTIKALFQYQK